MRTPLLPIDELMAWGQGLGAAAAARAGVEHGPGGCDPDVLDAALAQDTAVLRARLRTIVERPEVREALYLGSPSVEAGVHAWLADPDSQRGQRMERALVRYVQRMAGRATPLGLFAGHSLARVAGRTNLRLSGACARRTRLSIDVIHALCASIERDPDLRARLVYRPNPTLHELAGALRFHELTAAERRLVAVQPSTYLDAIVARARHGARRDELAAALLAHLDDGETSLEDALEFIDQLIDAEILIADLAPPISGDEPLGALVAALGRHGAHGLESALQAISRDLEDLDRAGLGNPPSRYVEIMARLAQVAPALAGHSPVFSVDLLRPAPECTLGQDLVHEILQAIDVLRRLHPAGPDPVWSRFAQAFTARFGDREVPLVEALDSIGFGRLADAGVDTPWLRGLPLHRSRGPGGAVQWTRAMRLLFSRMERAWQDGAHEICIAPHEVADWDDTAIRPLPDAVSAMVTVIGPARGDLASRDVRVALTIVAGPSGVRQLARLGHDDPGWRRQIDEHLRAEEAHRSDAVFAEIVHVPAGRAPDICVRPALRAHEIPCIGRSGLPAEQQIPLADLMVSVRGERVLLRSQRLGKEILPRLSAADNFKREPESLYAFLCEMQAQHAIQWLFLHLGPLLDARFLPRIRCGRVILLPALWNLSPDELSALARPTRAARFLAVQRLRAARRLPRFVGLSQIADTEQVLPVDLDNALSVEAFVHLIKGRASASLKEIFVGADEVCASGPAGRYVHELVIPLVQKHGARPRRAPPRSGRRDVWLQAMLDTSPASADRLLVEVVRPFADRAGQDGILDHWHFVRREGGLQIRLAGRHEALGQALLGALPAIGQALTRVTFSRHAADERGGPWPWEALARLACADSRAVTDLLAPEVCEELGERMAMHELDCRFWLTVASTDLLFAALGLGLRDKLRVARALAAHDRLAFATRRLLPQIGRKYRGQRAFVERLLGAGDPLRGTRALAALERRSRDIAAIASGAAAGSPAGDLTIVARAAAGDHAGRMLRSAWRPQRLVVYEILARHHGSLLAGRHPHDR